MTTKKAYNITDFYEEAFKNYDIPYDIQEAAIRICNAYGIKGICDPVYICNIIASSLDRATEVKRV
jgi:hypothetical protein